MHIHSLKHVEELTRIECLTWNQRRWRCDMLHIQWWRWCHMLFGLLLLWSRDCLNPWLHPRLLLLLLLLGATIWHRVCTWLEQSWLQHLHHVWFGSDTIFCLLWSCLLLLWGCLLLPWSWRLLWDYLLCFGLGSWLWFALLNRRCLWYSWHNWFGRFFCRFDWCFAHSRFSFDQFRLNLVFSWLLSNSWCTDCWLLCLSLPQIGHQPAPTSTRRWFLGRGGDLHSRNDDWL
jgi:hypothetical protein